MTESQKAEIKELFPKAKSRYEIMKERGQLPTDYRTRARLRVESWEFIPPVITAVDCAALLRVQESTLRLWRQMGLDEHGLPVRGPMWTQIGRGRILYRREDIERFFLRCQNGEIQRVEDVVHTNHGNLGNIRRKSKTKNNLPGATMPAHLAFRKKK